jgi:hypothetical protein
MPTPKLQITLGFAALIGAATLATPAQAVTSGNNGTHDPSRIIESDGKFYFCGTGWGLRFVNGRSGLG